MYRRAAFNQVTAVHRALVHGAARHRTHRQQYPRHSRAAAVHTSTTTMSMSAQASQTVPRLEAPDLSCAQEPGHVRSVSETLGQRGILKVSLGFADRESRYLEQLLRSLHQHHGHQLPISHSATRGWFWDVVPSSTSFQTANCQARSETMDDFPWHTDCSYEDPPPRYFALQVLQPDRCGGGTLSLMNVERLSERLSPEARASLARPEFLVRTPPEFVKHPGQEDIVASILLADGEGRLTRMRFREDLLTPLSERASAALAELTQALQGAEARGSHSTARLDLTPEVLPERSIIMIDNRRWLHARNRVRDPERHLRRVRWDAVPFAGLPAI
ncbi:Clavaminate synthase-like protein, partial [Trichoderma novae-zelandiae]